MQNYFKFIFYYVIEGGIFPTCFSIPHFCVVSPRAAEDVGCSGIGVTAVSHTVGAGDWTLGPLQEPVPLSAETFLQLREMTRIPTVSTG